MAAGRTDRRAKKRNYEKDLFRAERNSVTDIVTALILSLASAAGTVLFWTAEDLPEWADTYRYAFLSAGMSLFIYSLMKFFRAVSERRACKAIRKDSVYAVRLKAEQQKLISRILSRQSVREHFLCFFFILAVLTVILVLSYVRTGNSSSLIVLALASVLAFAVTLISYIRDIVRTASADGFCTVSGNGIIQAGRVFPFSAADGDVSELIRFSDYYSVRFITPGILGLLVKTDFPLPRRGAVSRELIGADEESVLTATLNPASYSEKEETYRHLPFGKESREMPAEEAETVVIDESLLLRIAAYAAAVMLIATVVIAANIS